MRPKLSRPGDYLAAYKLLIDDFLRLCQFVEPTDDNLGVYSHRTYELLLRSCTEFESICRDALSLHGKTSTIRDYAGVAELVPGLKSPVRLFFWNPQPVDITPLLHWSRQSPSLVWYKAYNSVKHDRAGAFRMATVEHLRHSLAAVFALLIELADMPWKQEIVIHPDGGILYARVARGYPFGIYTDPISRISAALPPV